MVVDGKVLVATIGATVAAATAVTGLKMGFCEGPNKIERLFQSLHKKGLFFCTKP